MPSTQSIQDMQSNITPKFFQYSSGFNLRTAFRCNFFANLNTGINLNFIAAFILLTACGFGTPSISAVEIHEPIVGAKVFYTPGDDAEGAICDAIRSTKIEILIQTYSFTSVPVAKALAEMAAKGIKIRIISDITNESSRYTALDYVAGKDGVEVVTDRKVAIAHNKVMILDGKLTITGSFNFTKAAQHSNAENCIFLPSKELADAYTKNWNARYLVSRPFVRKADR